MNSTITYLGNTDFNDMVYPETRNSIIIICETFCAHGALPLWGDTVHITIRSCRNAIRLEILADKQNKFLTHASHWHVRPPGLFVDTQYANTRTKAALARPDMISCFHFIFRILLWSKRTLSGKPILHSTNNSPKYICLPFWSPRMLASISCQ